MGGKILLAISVTFLLCQAAIRVSSLETPAEDTDVNKRQLLLFDELMNIRDEDVSITIEKTADFKQRMALEQSTKLVGDSQKDVCAAAIKKMTSNLYSYPYDQMLVYSAKDINDMGRSDDCRKLTNVARFYIISIGVKQLPLALRVGMCFPYECTPEVVEEAFQKITSTLNEVIEPLMKDPPVKLPTDVIPVFKIEAISTDKWNSEQRDNKASSSYAFLCFGGVLLALTWLGSSYYHFSHDIYADEKKKFYDPDNNSLNKSDISQSSMSSEMPGNISGNQRIQEASNQEYTKSTIDNSQDRESKSSNAYNINYSMYESVTNALRRRIVKSKNLIVNNFKERPLIKAILSSFSLQVSFESLYMSRRHDEEHEELEVLEGIRALTMFWGIFCATSLYVLTAYVKNIYEMLNLFKSITFTMVASGNLSPDMFLFLGFFLSFVKISQLYDQRDGIIPSLYAKLVFYRYIKYAPMYYFVFFMGWSIFPYLSSADTWYLSETLFHDCEKYWWSNLLFISNLYPWFTEGLNGCYYWPFMIICDFQLYLMIPLCVILFKRKHLVFQFIMILFAVGGSIMNYFLFYASKLSVGVLTLENYYLFSENFNKPHTKLPLIAFGCWMGQFYLNVLEYRKHGNDVDKKKANFGLIHIIHSSNLVKVFLIVYGIVVLNLTTLIPFTANKDAYSWTRTENALYNAFAKFGYITPIMGLLALVFCERVNFLHGIMGNVYFRPFSRVTLGAYLVYPIVIMLCYTGFSQPIFLSMLGMIYLFIYNLVGSFLIAFILFLFLQSPIHHIVGTVIFKYREITSVKEYIITEGPANEKLKSV